MRTTRSGPCPRRSRFVTPRLGDAIDPDPATGVGIVTGEVLASGSGTGMVSVVGEADHRGG